MHLHGDIAAVPFKLRWKARLASTILRNAKFVNVLRFDYATDWIVLLMLTQSVLVGVTGLGPIYYLQPETKTPDNRVPLLKLLIFIILIATSRYLSSLKLC